MPSKEFIITDINSSPLIKTFRSTVPSGKREYREHHHTECEFSMCLHGHGIYNAGNVDYEFRDGDVFIFGSDEIHCITNIFPSAKLELVNIHFEPSLLWASGDMSTLPLLMLFNDRSPSFCNMIERENPNTPDVRRLILEIEQHFKSDSPTASLEVKIALYRILLILFNEYGYVNPKKDVVKNARIFKQLSNAMQYINENLSSHLTLSELSQTATMSKSYFSTVFKKYNGISPWNYITIKRVEAAINLLASTDLTKLEIAEMCGFTSSANFYKSFVAITGKKPSYYVKGDVKNAQNA